MNARYQARLTLNEPSSHLTLTVFHSQRQPLGPLDPSSSISPSLKRDSVLCLRSSDSSCSLTDILASFVLPQSIALPCRDIHGVLGVKPLKITLAGRGCHSSDSTAPGFPPPAMSKAAVFSLAPLNRNLFAIRTHLCQRLQRAINGAIASQTAVVPSSSKRHQFNVDEAVVQETVDEWLETIAVKQCESSVEMRAALIAAERKSTSQPLCE